MQRRIRLLACLTISSTLIRLADVPLRHVDDRQGSTGYGGLRYLPLSFKALSKASVPSTEHNPNQDRKKRSLNRILRRLAQPRPWPLYRVV